MSRAKKKTGDLFVVITTTDDGEAYLQLLSKEEILKQLTDEELTPLTRDDIWGELAGSTIWEFAATGRRGSMIFPFDALVVPTPKERVTEWEMPD